MKRFLLIALIVAGACNGWAQEQKMEKLTEVKAPINIASPEVRKSFIPPADANLKSGVILNSDFQVEFINCPENAKAAFLYAVSIYENLITSTVPIKVQVEWKDMGNNVLSSCSPSSFYKNFNGAHFSDVYYPISLVEKLAKTNINGDEPDITCSVNENINWYLGTNGDGPSNQYDLVTVALHELIHGLGFVGFFNVDGNLGELDNGNAEPSIYDLFIYNGLNKQLANNDNFVSPSEALKSALVSDDLVVQGTNASTQQKIYAPSNWSDGSSIYHYSESGVAQGDANALMTPIIFKGEAIHHPGDKTLELLAAFGWKSLTIEGAEIKDFEEAVATLPVAVEVSSELDIDMSSVKINYSTDNFASSNAVALSYNAANKQFEGELPLDNQKGKISYYYEASTTSNVKFTCPDRAPERKYSFTIGADYYPPVLYHNPEKLLASSHPILSVDAFASDNVAIKTVQIEYRINGELQDPVEMVNESANNYSGQVEFPLNLSNNDVVEYRILAQDNTARGNKRAMPNSGFYQVEVIASELPLYGYYSDFDSENEDFDVSDFEVSRPSGFSSGNLHTINPYPESSMENERYSLLAQLKYPIIIEENGMMSFDEVVLVEPGEEGTTYTEEMFWDFVIVEGSKNHGKSWLPVTEGYDSGVDELWSSNFNNSLKSTVSEASGAENMFLTQYINLTENTEFAAGDTVLFRFRLASDKAVTGWGWAIDNLSIQEVTTAAGDDILAASEVTIYPNPFKQSIYVEGFEADQQTDVDIIITDLYGKTVFRETKYDANYNRKLKIDIPDVAPGVYLASITDNQKTTITQKIIKN